jgi:ferritin-like metal-binding protein YciE
MMHYAIAGYGSARSFAGTLGDNNAHVLLQESLNDAADADRALTKLAEDIVNLHAAEPEQTAVGGLASSHVEEHDGQKIR